MQDDIIFRYFTVREALTFAARLKLKLTEEQQQLAMDRAQRYGRRYPNPIDNAWVLDEGKAPSIVADKNKVGNMASLRPDDEKKLKIMNSASPLLQLESTHSSQPATKYLWRKVRELAQQLQMKIM